MKFASLKSRNGRGDLTFVCRSFQNGMEKNERAKSGRVGGLYYLDAKILVTLNLNNEIITHFCKILSSKHHKSYYMTLGK